MKKKKADKPTYNIPLRRQSFSDFSQSYSNGINKKNLSYSEKTRRKRTIFRIIAVLGLLALFIAGYVTVSVMLDLSKTPSGSSPAAVMPAAAPADSPLLHAEAADARYSV